MTAMAKSISFEFGALDDLQDMLKDLEANTDEAIDRALIDSQKLVADKAEKAMEKHDRTGNTKASIVRDKIVKNTGMSKTIGVGFDIKGGGLPSIFLMYGTTLHGQPHIEPDKELYDAIFGKRTQKEIEEVQERAFQNAIEEAMK